MNTIILLSLLLQTAATPEQHGRSTFVDFDHQHEWVKLDDIKGGSVWGDKSSAGRVTAGEEVYPLILTRIVFERGASPWGRIESLHAVDCQSNQIATFKGNVARYPVYVDKIPDFAPWSNPDSAGVRSMMSAACGKDWSL